MPSRNVSVTAHCEVCHVPLPTGRARATCSDACRQKLWRRRHHPNSRPAVPEPRPSKPTTVYACPTCDTRQLGDQYCRDCNTFMHNIGTGGHCPCCDEPITTNELLEPPAPPKSPIIRPT